MGFFSKKRNNNKSNSTSGSYGTGSNDSNDVALQGRMQDLHADMQRVRQRHEAEMQMLNKRMVSIVAKVHTAAPPSSSKAVPPPPPPGPPPGGLPPSRRRSRGRGTAGRDSSIHSSNISQHSSDNQSNSQRRRRSSQEQKVHTRHFYQLPQPIQSAPPVPEISIVARSVGSAAASTSSSRNHHYPGDDNSSHDTSRASQSSYSYKNGRKVRTVYRTVRAIHDDDVDRAAEPPLAQTTTTSEHKIRTSHSSGRSRQPGTISSSSYDENGIVVRNHPPPQNSPIRSNFKPLRGRVHATDTSYDDVGSSSSPRSITDRNKNRRHGEYQTMRKNIDTTVKEEWTTSRPVTENSTVLSERNSSRRNYHDHSTPERDRPNRSSLSDGIRNNRKGSVSQPTSFPVDVRRDDAYNHKPQVAHTNPHDVYEATDHVQNRSTRPKSNQVTPRPVGMTRPPPNKPGGPPIDLMASIRAGVQLKSVSDEKDSEQPRVPQESPVNVLMAAIQERKKRILAQEEDDEVDW